MVRIKRSNTRGFTLIELLIVVAIIGILATIGVPTFRRMVQKSKQSEAKVALGALFTAEAAFYSEYGGYGSHITRVGFELDGTRLNYLTGFPTGACGNIGPIPSNPGTAVGVQINNSFPQYYTNDLAVIINGVTYNPAGFQTVIGRVTGGLCLAGVLVDPGAVYTASSTGCIMPGCVPGSALAPAVPVAGVFYQDAWTIDNTRLLRNTNYGVSQGQ